MEKKEIFQKVARGIIASNKIYYGNTRGSVVRTNMKKGRKVQKPINIQKPVN